MALIARRGARRGGSTAAKATPSPTPETLPYWEAAARGELSLPFCPSCDAYVFYPRGSCPRCWGIELTWRTLSGNGRLHSYLISHVPAPGFEEDVPYAIAIVELDEGPRMMSGIRGVPQTPEALTLDMPLVVDFEARGEWSIPVFRPRGETSGDDRG